MLQHLMCLPYDAYLLLKEKTFSLLSHCDYRMIQYLEERVRQFKIDKSSVKMPEQLTIGQNTLQEEVVDFLVSFLEDPDHRVRHKSGKVLVKMIPKVYYHHYFDNSEKRMFAVCKRILDMQTSQHVCIPTKIY